MTFSLIHPKILFDLQLQIHSAGLWLAFQGRRVVWCLFIAAHMLSVYVVPTSKDSGGGARLCLTNHCISLIAEEGAGKERRNRRLPASDSPVSPPAQRSVYQHSGVFSVRVPL